MQVPGASIAPAGPAASAPAVPVEAPPPAAAPTAPAFGSDVPVVQVGDDEHWRKTVSRKRPAAKKSSGALGWLVPILALAVCGLVAAGTFVWMQQGQEVAVDHEEPPVEVAQSSADDESASDDVEEPAKPADAPTDPSEPENIAASSDPPQPADDADGPTVAATSPGGNDAAMNETPPSSDAAAETPTENTSSETVASNDTDAAENADAAVTAKTEPVELKGPPEEVLKEHGIRIVGEQATLIDESRPAIAAALSEAKKLRLSLTRSYADAMKLERLQKELKVESANRSAALAQVNATGGSAQANNVLVGQIRVIETKLEEIEKQVESSRAKLAEARESYIEHLLKTREIVEGVDQKYAEAAADPQVKAALAKLSKDGNAITLEPLGSFYRVQKELETLESQVLSDTVVARVQSGNLFVPTQINGEHTIEMIVDSGASVVTIPYNMAVEAGLKPKDTDPVATFKIANGALIKGQMITIPSLRVGKFTVENVEAAVLGPEATDAEPLLGMSFLSKFEMKIDSQRGQLILSHIEGTEGSDRIRK